MASNLLLTNLVDQFQGCKYSQRIFQESFAASGDWRQAERDGQEALQLSVWLRSALSLAARPYRKEGRRMRAKLDDLHTYMMKRHYVRWRQGE